MAVSQISSLILIALLQPLSAVRYAKFQDAKPAKNTAPRKANAVAGKSRTRDLNAADSEGMTPLMHAAMDDDVRHVRALLAAGASVNAHPLNGATALMIACQSERDYECARTLIAAHADVNVVAYGVMRSKMDEATGAAGSNTTALLMAIRSGSLRLVKLLIAAHVDVNPDRMDTGILPLTYAAQLGFEDIVRALIAAHADVKAEDINGEESAALVQAVVAGNVECVRILVASHADVNTKDENGCKVLVCAYGLESVSKRNAIVRILKSAGAKK